MEIKIFFDGAHAFDDTKKKAMGIGVAVYIENELSQRHAKAIKYKNGTNNIAEYLALIKALEVAIKLSEQYNKNIYIFGDSQLVINQTIGAWKVKKEHLNKYNNKAKELFRELREKQKSKGLKTKLKWVQRNNNKIADAYSKSALRLKCSQNPLNYK